MRIVVTLIALLLILTAMLTGCINESGNQEDEKTGSGTYTDAGEPQVTVFENGAVATQFKIIWPTRPADDEYTASSQLVRAFADCGVTIVNDRDYITGTPENEFEILIGKTNREASRTLNSGLKDDDWVIAVSGTKIVICGGTPAATLNAAQKFITDYLPAGTDSLALPADLYIKTAGTYPVADFLINGTPISEFRLIEPSGANKLETYAITLFTNIIRERAGVTLSNANDRTEAEGNEIRIGATSRSGEVCGDYEYTVYADGGSIIINGGKHAIVKAVLEFIKTYLPETSATAINAEIGEIRTTVSTENIALPHEASLDAKNLVALCDQKNASVVVVDLGAPDPTSASAIVWTFKPTYSLGFTSTSGYANSVDEAILRYSEVLGSYVVCVTSSSGFIGVAKYPSGECVWSNTASGLGPHSIEYLPNGNVAVVCSGNSNTAAGCLRIYTASQGKNSSKYTSVSLVSAHGVVWDDENELLWALGNNELRAYRIGGTDADPTLTEVDGMGGKIPVSGGHNLSVNSTDPDYLWISGSGVCQYRKSTGTFTQSFTGSSVINAATVKSIDSFPDGTVVRTIATNVYKEHDTDRLVFFTPDGSGGFTRHEYTFTNRAFYKARRFSAQYS